MTNVKEPFDELREKTDQSLKDERNKTDDYLTQKSLEVEKDASDTIRLTRLAADKDRTDNRAAVAPLDDKKIIQERKRSDQARDEERKVEDRIHATERLQKRWIAQSFLESERKETDINLLDERAYLDLASEQSFDLLSGEKNSHDLTKTALVTRDQFLAVVSHDLRNPLGVISASADLMRLEMTNGVNNFSSLLNYVDIIDRNAVNMDRMISDLLDVERMTNDKLSLSLKKCDVSVLLQECSDLLAPVITSKSFTMEVHTSDKSMLVDMDHDRILQVLSNLIGNAIKFTPKGGTIKLTARMQKDAIEISVTDNGPGIPEEKALSVFERFSQLRAKDRRGLGLGLYISKWIVEAHKGRIWVTSGVGKGSTFSFTIPTHH